MSEQGKPDQRKSPRVDYEVQVDVTSEDNFFTGFIKNISSGGLFIATHIPQPVGTELTVRFTVPTWPKPITARAIVRWVRQYGPHAPDSIPGMGVQFVDVIPNEALKAINDFIKTKREPEFFED